MTYKDILVYADSDTVGEKRLDLAANLAGSLKSRVVALHVSTPPYVPAIAGAEIPIELIASQEEHQRQQAEAARQVVERIRQRSGVDFEWRLAAGDLSTTTLLHSRYADLVVIGQASGDDDEPRETDILPETIAFGAGRPVLIVPRYGNFPKCGERVLIAWKRTRESTRAVHDALPLLTRAKSVLVMEINPDQGDKHIAGADIALHLARHGVKADVSSTVASEIDVGNAILSRAADVGADLLVMGAYGHSRLRQIVFGGVTLEVLRHMTVPVLMSH
jgi:nucleotide-binding universal stress UspA family protein